MPIRHSIWQVGTTPAELREGMLPSEALLEDMIVTAPQILSDQWMIVGRQVETGTGGRIDLLAIAPDGALILIELKRHRTPRDVVAQAIDYASCAEDLDPETINRIYARYANGRNLAQDFQARFDLVLDETNLNQSHQIVIVASSLDASSERIVSYLNKRDIAINVLCFQVFETDRGQLLSRAWLLDPIDTQVAATVTARSSEREPWNGEYYVSFGEGDNRSWEEARRYGFICAGHGAWYIGTLRLLKEGDRIWVRIPKVGYVGVGLVTGEAKSAREFHLKDAAGNPRPALEVLSEGYYLRDLADDLDLSEYFVPVRWLDTVNISKAFDELGLFGNQNTVCAPKTVKWRHTIERLKSVFPNWDKV